jgi:hypothetical protein
MIDIQGNAGRFYWGQYGNKGDGRNIATAFSWRMKRIAMSKSGNGSPARLLHNHPSGDPMPF